MQQTVPFKEGEVKKVDIKIIIFFGLSALAILLSVIFLFINFRKIDERYSRSILNNSVILVASRSLNDANNIAQRMLLNAALSANEQERVVFISQWDTANATSEKSFRLLEKTVASNPCNQKYASLVSEAKTCKENYVQSSKAFLALTKGNDMKVVSQFLETDLRPKFELYQEQQKLIFVHVNDNLLKKSKEISNYTMYTGWALLFIGLCPFLYVAFKFVFLIK